MTYQPQTEYLKTQIMTASPEMLQLMLWDGAIRFAEQGKEGLLKKDIETSHTKLVRAQQIIIQLATSMKRDVNPDLCEKLSALYNFMYRRLVDANVKKDVRAVDDALEIMRHQRETWVMLMNKLLEERTGQAQATARENAAAVAASNALPSNLPLRPSAPATPARPRSAYGLASRPLPAASLSVQG